MMRMVTDSERHTLHAGDGLQIAAGQFHTVEVKEPSILSAKGWPLYSCETRRFHSEIINYAYAQ